MISAQAYRRAKQVTHEELIEVLGALTAALVVLSPILTGLGAAFGSWITGRRAARRDDLQALQVRVDALEKERELLYRERIVLWDYVRMLRGILQEHDIDVPELPDLPQLGKGDKAL